MYFVVPMLRVSSPNLVFRTQSSIAISLTEQIQSTTAHMPLTTELMLVSLQFAVRQIDECVLASANGKRERVCMCLCL
jgi:hypothetical protein